MTRTFLASELEGVATWWRVMRSDGVTLGFTSHDRDLTFDGLRHRAAPGMLPSAIRRTAGFERDSVEVEGALSHDAISADDLANGRFDEAEIAIGVVDWETLERQTLFHGRMGEISQEDQSFSAELRSAKARLETDAVPRTSPTCRAAFCGADCGLSPARFTHLATVSSVDEEDNAVTLSGGPDAAKLRHGSLRFLDGVLAGTWLDIVAVEGAQIVLARTLSDDIEAGAKVFVREGCDHTVATCATRFGNTANFRGEPFLPGNDLLARYPVNPS